MEISILVARIVAVLYIAVSVGVLFDQISFKKLYLDMIKNAGLMYIMGLFALVIGFILVHYHNIWAWNWTVLVTLIGWAALIKGVMIITFPKSLDFFKPMFTGKFLGVFPYFTLVFGLIFGYFGFIA